ncbi:hypothetical protein HPB50_019757 [Hyalomma asiaticum]|uniref:Uncharacterized protein n=1 Tax=Hyalomma asiaticum TaxID=266040 RepID=A0ACB7RVX4_HYAAI|nr:hypothetical protein HPB50_019757 [Hyalomma asiaticum]
MRSRQVCLRPQRLGSSNNINNNNETFKSGAFLLRAAGRQTAGELSLIWHLSKTYYEVLGVKKDCTQKEIRDAYVKLCKQLHPDVKGLATSVNDHRRFTELNQAYTTLSKPLDRKYYDNTLQHPELRNVQRTAWRHAYARYEEPFMHRKGSGSPEDEVPRYEDFAHMYNEQRRQHQNAKLYIVMGCFLLIVSGACIHYAAFRTYGMEGQMERLLNFKQDKKKEKDDESSEDRED